MGIRLRTENKFIQRELERIRINYPGVSMAVLSKYRYEWLRAAKNELLYPNDWHEEWE
jgi:hypothetical protein